MTVRVIFLLRHALAMPPGSAAQDSARSLSAKGLEDAQILGRIMAQKKYIPDVVLCSPAIRTRQTREALGGIAPPEKTALLPILYDGGTQSYFEALQGLPDSARTVLLIGHNPCVHECAAGLAGDGPEAMLQRLLSGYKPATLSVLALELKAWADLRPRAATLTDLLDAQDYAA